MIDSSSRRRRLVLAGVATGALAVLVASPSLLGDRVADALDEVRGATPAWLWLATACFVAMHTCTAIAWSVALRACDVATEHGDAVARYGVGSALNALAPAHAGSAVRIALFARTVDRPGAVWTVGGAAAAVGAVRAVWFTALVAAAAAAGVVPAWPLVVLAAGLALAALLAVVSRRLALRARIAHVLDAFRELSRDPRSTGSVAALTLASLTAKIAGAAAVAASLGVERPLVCALVMVPAVELAAAMPLTPGNAGVASAAVALALGTQGVASTTALSVGIAFGAVETLAAAGIGSAGALVLFGSAVRPVVRMAALGAGSAAVAVLFTATVVLPIA